VVIGYSLTPKYDVNTDTAGMCSHNHSLIDVTIWSGLLIIALFHHTPIQTDRRLGVNARMGNVYTAKAEF
jgi:hypothetical protein